MPAMELKEFQDHLVKWQGDIQKQVSDLLKVSGDSAETARKALETELDTVKKTLHSVEEQIKTAAAKSVPGMKDELQKNHFDMGMVVQAMYREKKGVTGDGDPWRNAKPELEMIKAYQAVCKADNYATDGSLGGYLIPNDVTSEFIEMVTAQMPLKSLGINIVKGLVGDLPVPKKTGRTSAYMVGENTKPTHSGITLGQVTLRPKKAGAFTKQSNRLIYQSRGVSDKIIRDDLTYAMQKKIETMCLSGTGAGYEPKGLFTHTGFTTSNVSLGTNGGRFKIDDAAAMITDIECADEINNAGGKYGFLMHPRAKSGMKRERVIQYSGGTAAAGQPVLPMNLLMSDKVLADQLGYAIASTTLVPANKTVGTSTTCSDVTFGDWNLFWLGIWRDFWLKVSDQAGDGSTGSAFLDDEMYIVAFQEFDTAIMRESALTVANGAETTESSW